MITLYLTIVSVALLGSLPKDYVVYVSTTSCVNERSVLLGSTAPDSANEVVMSA